MKEAIVKFSPEPIREQDLGDRAAVENLLKKFTSDTMASCAG